MQRVQRDDGALLPAREPADDRERGQQEAQARDAATADLLRTFALVPRD